MGAAKVACGIIKPAVALKTSLTLSGMLASTGFDYHIHEGGDCTGGDAVVKGMYFKRRERASRNGSTVVDISMTSPSFKPVSLSLSRSSLYLKHPNMSFF